jgi:hypothetical protein
MAMAQAIPVLVSWTPSFFWVAFVSMEEQVTDPHLLHEHVLEGLELLRRVLRCAPAPGRSP